MKKPLLTKERIVYWLTSFKSGNIEDIEYQRRVIDTLVNSVFVYDSDDGGRLSAASFSIRLMALVAIRSIFSSVKTVWTV